MFISRTLQMSFYRPWVKNNDTIKIANTTNNVDGLRQNSKGERTLERCYFWTILRRPTRTGILAILHPGAGCECICIDFAPYCRIIMAFNKQNGRRWCIFSDLSDSFSMRFIVLTSPEQANEDKTKFDKVLNTVMVVLGNLTRHIQ